jgi:L-fuculose-phosphate aldolase
MFMREERRELIEYGKKISEQKLTRGTGGNLSLWNQKENLMAITPSGIPYQEIQENQVVLMEVETGKVVDGQAVPSSEYDMHRIFYKYRTDLHAIIHTHTTYSATVACLRHDLPALHYMVAYGGGIDVRCADYATYGTVRLAKNAFEAMKDRNACLLANHGLLTGGRDLAHAFNVTEEIEFCCELYCRTMAMGNPVILDPEEMTRMVDRFKDYGKRIEEHEEI